MRVSDPVLVQKDAKDSVQQREGYSCGWSDVDRSSLPRTKRRRGWPAAASDGDVWASLPVPTGPPRRRMKRNLVNLSLSSGRSLPVVPSDLPRQAPPR